MSEYQSYKFMAIDRPLTREQMDAVADLSSHIEVTSTSAFIEYRYGDFKHNPIGVLREFFDGFLYWANWGSPQLALRFPHGMLPANLLDGYDFNDFVTFTRHSHYDILDIHFNDLEGPDNWIQYKLASLIDIRDELMRGDLRALYIVWLASRCIIEGYEEYEDDEEEDEEINIPPEVPPAFGSLTAAQQALAELLQVPQELLIAASQYSSTVAPSINDDFAAWVELLPQDSRNNYLVRLALNEPGLSSTLVKELRTLGHDKPIPTSLPGERVLYAVLVSESEAIEVTLEQEKYEQERLANQRRLQEIYDHQDGYWHQVDLAVRRGTGSGYDEAERLLVRLLEAANQFNESQEFQFRFRNWIRPHLRRRAFIKRLQGDNFAIPEM